MLIEYLLGTDIKNETHVYSSVNPKEISDFKSSGIQLPYENNVDTTIARGTSMTSIIYGLNSLDDLSTIEKYTLLMDRYHEDCYINYITDTYVAVVEFAVVRLDNHNDVYRYKYAFKVNNQHDSILTEDHCENLNVEAKLIEKLIVDIKLDIPTLLQFVKYANNLSRYDRLAINVSSINIYRCTNNNLSMINNVQIDDIINNSIFIKSIDTTKLSCFNIDVTDVRSAIFKIVFPIATSVFLTKDKSIEFEESIKIDDTVTKEEEEKADEDTEPVDKPVIDDIEKDSENGEDTTDEDLLDDIEKDSETGNDTTDEDHLDDIEKDSENGEDTTDEDLLDDIEKDSENSEGIADESTEPDSDDTNKPED